MQGAARAAREKSASGIAGRIEWSIATGCLLTQDPIGLGGGVNLYSYAGSNPIAFDDPFGLECKETGNCVQGDGGTEEARAWEAQHITITASNGTDYEGVDPALKTAVVRAAVLMGDATLGISAGKESGHSIEGRHSEGGAVDINQVNGVRFRDMPPETAAQTGNTLGANITNSLPSGRALMVYTPGMAFRLDKVITAAQTRALMRLHSSHVHITVTGP